MLRHPWRNGNATAPDTQGPGFDSWRVSIFSIISLLPFFYAALVKRWNVQFRQGFAYFNNNVDSNRHIIIITATSHNEMNSGQIMKNTIYIYIYT